MFLFQWNSPSQVEKDIFILVLFGHLFNMMKEAEEEEFIRET